MASVAPAELPPSARFVGAEPGPGVVDEPERGRLAIVRRGRPRVLGRESVVDTHDRDPERLSELQIARIPGRRRAQVEATTGDVEVHRPRLRVLRHEDPQGNPRPEASSTCSTATVA